MSANYTNFTNKTRTHNPDLNLLFKEESFQIVGAAMEVHKTLGCGFLEPVYQEALEKEFAIRDLPFNAQFPLRIRYKDIFLQKTYIADFIAYDKIIVELKAVDELNNTHTAQVLNYLKATNFHLGILLNFGSTSLQSKRILF